MKKVWRFGLCLAILFTVSLGFSPGQQEGFQKPKDKPKVVKKYQRGRVVNKEKLKTWVAINKRKHGKRISMLPTPTAPSFDCRDYGWVGPVQDQGNCGSCWDVSHCGVVTNAFIKAGQAKNDGSFVISPQYVLDCGSNGGCNGDDGPTVLDMAKSKGLPTTADYGPYVAGPQRCAYTNQKLWQIKDWGFCTGDQSMGIATVAQIKACLVQFGPLGTGVSASGWDSYNGGVMEDQGGGVDHDVSIIGWKDDSTIRSGGYWIVLNQWGESWGEKGCVRLAYGANSIGSEACWVTVATLPPPPGGLTVTCPGVTGPVNQAVTFSPAATGGTQPYTFSFDYGDGTVDAKASHSYTTAGSYTVTITATDASSVTGVGTCTATIGAGPLPPVPTNPSITLGQDMKAGTYYLIQKAIGDSPAINLLNPQPLPPGLTPAEIAVLRELLQKLVNDKNKK